MDKSVYDEAIKHLKEMSTEEFTKSLERVGCKKLKPYEIGLNISKDTINAEVNAILNGDADWHEVALRNLNISTYFKIIKFGYKMNKGLNSLISNIKEFIEKAEQEFDIQIPKEYISKIHTVKDFLKLILGESFKEEYFDEFRSK